MTISFEEAKELLGFCKRLESRDHYFGDREVYWEYDGEEVACGYFGGGAKEVSIILPEQAQFYGEEARVLAKCGKVVNIGRNDETGPDQYRGA